jgi:hypothetical protein
MADNETIRELLSGFSEMRRQLGLIPMQSGASAMGVPPTVIAPPPPMPHPSEAAMMAMQQQQAMMQQNLQMAQMTRYQPPPSAPAPSVMNMSGSMNPYMANALGGGMNLPSPALMTPSIFGGYRQGFGGPQVGVGGPARMPSIFNPFAPTLPSPMFSAPALYHAQQQQAHSDQMLSMMTGAVHFGAGAAGGAIGAGIGSMFGPIGTFAGGLLGRGLGHVAGGLLTGTTISDISRGREIQRMTSPFMVSGAMLNPLTGSGVSRTAGLEIASGIRHLNRDEGFERTGFNTGDAMKIMNLAGQQGLLIGSQSPDQVVGKVKELSKSVHMIMKITGDPDFQNALRALGEMRGAGFMGLAAQNKALQNRSMFAQMAGVSMNQMAELQGAGGMTAMSMGMASSVGYSAAAAGAGMANIGISSGAVNDMQLSRVGGRSGLGQVVSQMGMAAVNDPTHMAAALTRGADGRVTIDPDRWRAIQKMSISEVANLAATNLRKLGVNGIQGLIPMMGELKSQLAQKINPMEMAMGAMQQAQGLMATGGPSNYGAAFMSMGMDEASARAAERLATSKDFFRGMQQQMGSTMRQQAIAERRAEAASRTTAGAWTRLGRGIRGALFDTVDVASGPFGSFAEYMASGDDNLNALEQGQSLRRYSSSEMVRNDSEERLLRSGVGMLTGDLGGRSSVTSGTALKASLLASEAGSSGLFGKSLGPLLRSPSKNIAMLQDITGVAQASDRGKKLTSGDRAAVANRIGGATFSKAVSNLLSKIDDKAAGTISGASAIGISEVRQAFIDASDDKAAAARQLDGDPNLLPSLVDAARRQGTDKHREVLDRSDEIGLKTGGLDLSGKLEGIRNRIRDDLSTLGVSKFSEKAQGEAKDIIAGFSSAEDAAIAAVVASPGGDLTTENALRKRIGKDYEQRKAAIVDKMTGMGADGKRVLAMLAGKPGGANSLINNMTTLRGDYGGSEAYAALEEFARQNGGKAGGSVVDTLKSISADSLSTMTDRTQGLVKRVIASGGKDSQALGDLLASNAVRQNQTSAGTHVMSEFDRLKKDIAEKEEQASEGGLSSEDQLNLAGEKLGLVAEKLDKVADKMLGSADADVHADANPWVQAYKTANGLK